MIKLVPVYETTQTNTNAIYAFMRHGRVDNLELYYLFGRIDNLELYYLFGRIDKLELCFFKRFLFFFRMEF